MKFLCLFKLFPFLILTISAQAADQAVPLTILYTGDLHSHVMGGGPDGYFTALPGDGDPVKGHYGRLSGLIKKIKKEKKAVNEPVLLIDSGDFFSGSLFHLSGMRPLKEGEVSIVPEWDFFSEHGYDAVTLGNHEFDAGEGGLVTLLSKLQKGNYQVPLVTSNLYLKSDSPLQVFYSNQTLRPYLIKEFTSDLGKTLKVGILGVMGPDAALNSSGLRSTTGFYGYQGNRESKDLHQLVKWLQNQVNFLKNDHDVDVVIVALHGGNPEDRQIAEKVSGINVIIAGHTHQALTKPLWVGSTLIVQAGSFGKYLGRAELLFENDNLKLRSKNNLLISVDDTLPVESEYLAKIERWQREVEKTFTAFNYTYLFDSLIFTAKTPLLKLKEVANPLGVFVTSGIKQEWNRHFAPTLDFYFTSLALIRSDFKLVEGKPTRYYFSDIFRMLSIGYDKEGRPGPEIITFYLSKEEVLRLIEFMEFYANHSANFTPVFSDDLSYRLRWWGLPFVNKIADLKLRNMPFSKWPALIHIGTNQYVFNYFSKVEKLTHGVVRLVPKDIEGKPLQDFTPSTSSKEFLLFSDYLRRLE